MTVCDCLWLFLHPDYRFDELDKFQYDIEFVWVILDWDAVACIENKNDIGDDFGAMLGSFAMTPVLNRKEGIIN